jgi:autotransporter-associated beta strand protein
MSFQPEFGRAFRRALLSTSAVALAFVAAPAWAGACAPGATTACSAPGGIGYPPYGSRGGPGGAGNGDGGGANTLVGADILVTPGAAGSSGNGGAGAAGEAAGGAGGNAGAAVTAVTNFTFAVPYSGAAGAQGSDGFNFAAGGGGGGAAIYFVSNGGVLTAAAAITGGAGGAGGNSTSGIVGNAGGGGGGGAAVISASDGATFVTNVALTGGAGGAGGSGGFGGGGGGGGDGLLVLGANSTISNTGAITGGAGGAGGAGLSASGTAGVGGAGVSLVGTGSTLVTTGTITGGAGSGAGAGAGVVTYGGATITNTGTISGGLDSDGVTRAAAIQFGGTGNTLSLQAGSNFVGALQLGAGAGATIVAQTSGLTLGNAIRLGSGSTATLDTSLANLTVSGVISGDGAVIATGAGTTTLTGTNTYTGQTTINSGATLQLGDAATNGTVAGDVVVNGALKFDYSGAATVAGAISGAGSAEVVAGTAVLTGTNTYTGQTTIDAGATLQLGDGVTNGTVAGDIVANGSLKFDYAGTTTVANVISGSGSAEVVAGTAVTTTVSFFDGAVAIDNGATLQFGDGTTSGVLFGSSYLNNGSLIVDLGAGTSVIPIGAISGSGSLTVRSGGYGTTSNNTFTGLTTIDSGAELDLSGAGSIAASSGVVDNGTLNIAATTSGASITTLSGSGTVWLGSQTMTLTDANDTFSGAISGSGGALVLTGGTERLTGALSYFGGTDVQGGRLVLQDITAPSGTVHVGSAGVLEYNVNSGLQYQDAVTLTGDGTVEKTGGGTLSVRSTVALSQGAVIDVEGGTLHGSSDYAADWTNNKAGLNIASGAMFNGVEGAIYVDVLTGSGVLAGGYGGVRTTTIGVAGGSGTFSGVIEDNPETTGAFLALTKVGSGTETLTGTNTYTGATTISGGTLALVGTGSIAASSGVTDNGVLDISGTTSGATITTLSGSGSLVLGNQTLTLANANDTFSGVISGSGGLAIAGGREVLTGSNTYTGATTVGSGGTLEIGDAAHPGAVLDSRVGGVTVASGGTLAGHGTILGAVTNAGGVVSPGGSIGTLTVGSYSQGTNGVLAIEVAPTQASMLKVLGAANLGGTLKVSFDPGAYAPHSYEILAGAPVSGTFSTVNLSGAQAGLAYGVAYKSDQVDLVIAPTAAARVYGDVSIATLNRAQSFASLVEDRSGDAVCANGAADKPGNGEDACHGMGAWAQAIASSDRAGAAGSAYGFRNTGAGFLGGVDHRWGPVALGVAFGYQDNDLSVSEASTSASGHAYFGSFYGRWAVGRIRLDGQAFYMNSDWSLRRGVAGYGAERSSPNGDTEGFLVQASAPIGQSGLSPYLRLSYARFNLDSLAEAGAAGSQGYTIGSGSSESTLGEVGFIYAHSYGEAGRQVEPALRVGLQREFSAGSQTLDGGLVGVRGAGFNVDFAEPDETAAVVDGSVKAQLTTRFGLSADLRGRFGTHESEGAVTVGGAYRF